MPNDPRYQANTANYKDLEAIDTDFSGTGPLGEGFKILKKPLFERSF